MDTIIGLEPICLHLCNSYSITITDGLFPGIRMLYHISYIVIYAEVKSSRHCLHIHLCYVITATHLSRDEFATDRALELVDGLEPPTN